MPVEERQNINFDHPDAFEWSLLSRHVAMLREGRSIEQNESAIKLAEAALNLSKLNLSYTVILATTDGVTGRKNIHEGVALMIKLLPWLLLAVAVVWVIRAIKAPKVPKYQHYDRWRY